MNALRRVTTASSVWTFDAVGGTYTRVPIVDGATHPNVPYQAEPVAYAHVAPYPVPGDHRLVVTHPDGSYLVTGAVLLDSIRVEVTA